MKAMSAEAGEGCRYVRLDSYKMKSNMIWLQMKCSEKMSPEMQTVSPDSRREERMPLFPGNC